MYNSFDYHYFLKQAYVPKLTRCADCRAINICKRDDESKSPCGDGRFLSFIYDKFKIPILHEISEADERDASLLQKIIVAMHYYKKYETILVGAYHPTCVLVKAFENISKQLDFISGIECCYTTPQAINDLYKIKQEGNSQCIAGMETCDILFIDNAEQVLSINQNVVKDLSNILARRKGYKCTTVIKVTNSHLDVIKLLGIEGEVVL